ncbi:MAG: sensor histidine kinase [Oscillospiraceae bacterium]|nr:sensor histidine kinase [Oscillospiraceae bacterium]
MKKLISFIPAALMFIILAVLFVFMCLPQNRSSATAQNGVLDLRGEEHIAPLRGQWEFIYGELLTPDELKDRPMGFIEVPESWVNQGYPLNGFATYRLTILTDKTTPLTLFLPEIFTAYELWVNGDILRTTGVVSGNPAEGRMLVENAMVSVAAENGVIELVIQISNYHFNEAGLYDTILIGETEAIQSWFFRTRTFHSIALGCILMAAFYHLTLFIYRRRERAYLFFSLLCFLCLFRFLMETNGLNQYFQWIPMNMFGVKLYLSLFVAHSIAICAFSMYIFNREFLRKHKFAIGICFGILFVLGIAFPTNTRVYIIVMFAAIVPTLLFTIILAARSRVLKENGALRLYFAALIVFLVVGSTSKLFYDYILFMTGLISNMFLIMSQSLVLSRRYTDAFRFVEETNTNLEQIVDERTKSLQAANEAMLITNNAMKELVTNISHDLKTPLHVMSINLETLSELTTTQSDATYQRHVRVAYQKNLDLQRLIRNLFEVSRIETDRNIYSPEWVSLSELLAQVKEKYDTYIEDHGINFEIDVKQVDGSNPCEVRATDGESASLAVSSESIFALPTESKYVVSVDSQKIWSVFDNIIFNAVHHTESGGSITITAQYTESSATITVADTGCGIDPKHLPRIFERFYKGSQERSANEGESGLGLYIVKSIMEGCSGSVSIESELGKGTSVMLTFPVM